jgi:hypothetical protein
MRCEGHSFIKRDTDEEDGRQDEEDSEQDFAPILLIPVFVLFVRVPLI